MFQTFEKKNKQTNKKRGKPGDLEKVWTLIEEEHQLDSCCGWFMNHLFLGNQFWLVSRHKTYKTYKTLDFWLVSRHGQHGFSRSSARWYHWAFGPLVLLGPGHWWCSNSKVTSVFVDNGTSCFLGWDFCLPISIKNRVNPYKKNNVLHVQSAISSITWSSSIFHLVLPSTQKETPNFPQCSSFFTQIR